MSSGGSPPFVVPHIWQRAASLGWTRLQHTHRVKHAALGPGVSTRPGGRLHGGSACCDGDRDGEPRGASTASTPVGGLCRGPIFAGSTAIHARVVAKKTCQIPSSTEYFPSLPSTPFMDSFRKPVRRMSIPVRRPPSPGSPGPGCAGGLPACDARPSPASGCVGGCCACCRCGCSCCGCRGRGG